MTMIETSTAYKVGDSLFSSMEDAQVGALSMILNTAAPEDSFASLVMKHKDEVLAILSMSEPVKRGRKPRSDQGKPHAKNKAKAQQEPSEPFGPGVKIEASEKYAGK